MTDHRHDEAPTNQGGGLTPGHHPQETETAPSVPWSQDIERRTLSVIVYGGVDPNGLDLDGSDFYDPRHEELFNVALKIGTPDAGLIKDACSDRLKPLVAGIVEEGIPANAGIYAAKLRELTAKRDLQAGLTRAFQQLWEPDADPAGILADLEDHAHRAALHGGRIGQLVDPAQVKAVRHEWIKKDWYPCDVVTVLAGHGGEGKSTFSLADIAAGSRGELHGRCWGRPVRSIIVATEDTQSDQKLRLRAAGADFRHVRFFTVENKSGDEVHFDLTRDLPELRAAAQHFGAGLLVIDPLSSVVPGDLNKADVIRAALDPLSALARDLHLAVLVIHHFNKGTGNASRKMTGSEVIRDAVRSAIFFAHDKTTGEHVLSFDKGNYSTLEGKNYAYELTSRPAIDDDGNQMIDEEGNLETVPFAMILEETDNSVERIINTLPQGQDREDRSEAEAFLIDYLSDAGGEAQAGEVLKAGRAAGFDDKQLRNARQRSKNPHIHPRKVGVPKGYWVWSLEDEGLTDLPKGSRRTQVPGVSPSVSPSSPSGEQTTAEDMAQPLTLVPDDPCPFCGKSLTHTPGQRICGANHRRAQEPAS